MTDTQQCPCNSEVLYTDCCEGVLSGQRKAATAEALMRSRYSAYVIGDITYLLQTWHPSTRPTGIDRDTIPDWYSLEIIQTKKGKADDNDGIVEFQATALSDSKILKLHEVSHFVKEGGDWLYVSGEITGDLSLIRRKIDKVGRNCLCPCGSGKKFKKCCGL
jgi:SEC-C motif domain protein